MIVRCVSSSSSCAIVQPDYESPECLAWDLVESYCTRGNHFCPAKPTEEQKEYPIFAGPLEAMSKMMMASMKAAGGELKDGIHDFIFIHPI